VPELAVKGTDKGLFSRTGGWRAQDVQCPGNPRLEVGNWPQKSCAQWHVGMLACRRRNIIFLVGEAGTGDDKGSVVNLISEVDPSTHSSSSPPSPSLSLR